MIENPPVELSDDDLWLHAEVQVNLLRKLLDSRHRRQPVGPSPYWFMVGLTVGRVQSLTRRLAERYAVEDHANFDDGVKM